MADSKIQSHQLVNQAALPVLRQPVRQEFDDLASAIDTEFGGPLRLFASNPSDAKLNIASNRVTGADGTTRTTPPIDEQAIAFAATTIDFQTGAVLPSGNVLITGNAFVLPASVTGQFKRFVFVLRSDGKIDCNFSADAASYAALPDAGTLFSAIEGLPIGWIDVVGTASASPGSFKTASSAGSSATSIIENAVSGASSIFKFSAGGGAGGSGGDRSFKLQAVTDPSALLKGGYLLLDNSNKELATYDGTGSASTDFGKDITINLDTVLGSNPANATTYHLYIDLDTLDSVPTTLSDNGRKLYKVIEANFKLLTDSPELVNRSRYVPIALVRSATSGTVWSGSGSMFATYPKFKADLGTVSINPVVYTKDLTAIGDIGVLGQIKAGHKFGEKSFPAGMSPTKRSHWIAEVDGSDQSGNTRSLTVGADVTFDQTNILGETNKAALGVAGTDSGFKNDAHIDFTDGDSTKSYMMCGWFNSSVWTSGSTYLMALGGAANSLFIFDQQGSGQIRFRTTSSVETVTQIITPGFVDNSWHFLCLYYDAVSFVGKLFIDGVLYATNVHTAGPVAWNTGGIFYGIDVSNSAPHLGPMHNFAFTKGQEFTDEQLHKLYATQIDHGKNVNPENQEWFGSFLVDGIKSQESSDWIVDKTDPNTLFADFSDFEPSDAVELKLKDVGFSASVVPAKNFRKIYSSDPGATIAHGLGETPTHIQVWQETGTANQWEPQDPNGLLSADNTNFYFNLGALAPIDATHRVKVVASCGDSAVVAETNSDEDGPAFVKLGKLSPVNGAPSAGQFRSVIENRSKMVDITNDLASHIGTERLLIQSLVRVNGERCNSLNVYRAQNDLLDRIRFCGSWETIEAGQSGAYVSAPFAGDSIEITFVGTGLSMHHFVDGTARTYDVYTDSASVTSTVTVPATTDVLVNQGYNASHIFNIVKGLSYGLHTVRIVGTGATQFSMNAIDFLNESTSIKTVPGTAVVGGVKRVVNAVQSSPYNTGFKNQYGTAGTKGGKVLQYLTKDGSIAKDVRWVDATALYDTSADHSNEELIRAYGFREFGGGYAQISLDLASMDQVSSRTGYYTLDDNTTSLTAVLSNMTVIGGYDNLQIGGSNRNVRLTAVCSGLDVLMIPSGGTTSGICVIDGVTTVNFGSFTDRRLVKVASGLPYGQHTFDFDYNGGAGNLCIEQFYAFGPKTPEKPVGAMPLSSYHIMADYSFTDCGSWTAGGNLEHSLGTVSKCPVREVTYVGSWTYTPDIANEVKGGVLIQTSTSGDSVEFEFLGTAVEIFAGVSNDHDVTIELDGVPYVGPATLSTGASTWTPGTSTWAIDNVGGSKLAISGLPFASHKVKLVFLVSSGVSSFGGFAVAPLVQSHVMPAYAVYGQYAALGAQALEDLRSYGDQLRIPPMTATMAGTVTGYSMSATTFSLIADMTTAFYSKTGLIEVTFDTQHRGGSGNFYVQFVIDGKGWEYPLNGVFADMFSSQNHTFFRKAIIPVGPGWHSIQAQCKVSASTVAFGDGGYRILQVRDI